MSPTVTDFLPPVVGRLTGDISDYLAKLSQAAAATEAFTKGVTEKVKRQTGPIGEEGRKSGDTYGGRFAESVSKKIDSAFKSLPKMKITADSTDSDVKLAALRAELEDLGKKRVGIDIDPRMAEAQLSRIAVELEALKKTSGNVALRFDISEARKGLDTARSMIRSEFAKIEKDVGAGGGGGLLSKLMGSAGPGGLAAGEGLMGVLGPTIAAASPTIAAGVASAVTAGLGLGFIGLGAFAVRKNQEVINAFHELGTQAKNVLEAAAAPLAGPFAQALNILRETVVEIGPALHDAFATIGPAIKPLAEGLGGFIKQIMPGLQAGLEGARPVIEQLGKELPGFGQALGSLIGDLGRAAPAAVEFLIAGFRVLDGVLIGLGNVLKVLSGAIDGAWHAWKFFGEQVGQLVAGLGPLLTLTKMVGAAFDDNAGSADMLGRRLVFVNQASTWTTLQNDRYVSSLDRSGRGVDGVTQSTDRYVTTLDRAGRGVDGLSTNTDRYVTSLDRAGRGIDGLSTATDRAAASARHYSGEITYTDAQLQAWQQQMNATTLTMSTLAGALADKMFQALMSVDQATLGVAESMTRLGDALKQNGRELDIHKAKGQANREAILAVVQANIQAYDSNIAAGMGAQDAARKYDDNTRALEAQLHKAHLTDKQISDLIGTYAGVPDKVNTIIATQGLTTALNNLGNLLAYINKIDGKKFGFTVVSTTVYQQDYSSYRAGERASGHMRGGVGAVHAAQGILSQPTIFTGGPTLYAFAEPETMQEAFVPRRTPDRSRALSILAQAASWHGAALITPAMLATIAAGAGSRGGGGGTTVQANLYLDSRLVLQQLIPAAQQQKQRTGTTGLS